MSDLDRFVHVLVEALRARDPAGVHRPLAVGDLRGSVLPYRLHRTALGLSAAEDYDLLVLRLCAEEGGFVRTFPPEVAERCREEVTGPNPDLRLVEELGAATIQIGAASLARVLAREPHPDPAPPARRGRFADWTAETRQLSAEPGVAPPAARTAEVTPPRPAPPPAAPPPPSVSPAGPAAAAPSPAIPPAAAGCRFCGSRLPSGRLVVFCPHCGERIEPMRCRGCGTELESGWRHCITCGAPVAESGTSAAGGAS
jgi:hypothetical protein